MSAPPPQERTGKPLRADYEVSALFWDFSRRVGQFSRRFLHPRRRSHS